MKSSSTTLACAKSYLNISWWLRKTKLKEQTRRSPSSLKMPRMKSRSLRVMLSESACSFIWNSVSKRLFRASK